MLESLSLWSVVIFLFTYAVIVSEKIDRSVAAFSGAAVVMLAGILSPEAAIRYIDFNTIGLLVGMMIIVGISRTTGLFEYIAVRAAKIARGEPLRVMASLSLITAVFSALLDNVTTVMLIVPVTLAITKTLGISPAPFLVAEILASNIGGTATLIGDPPNIMIGSATDLGFMDFVINLTPVVVVVYSLTMFILVRKYRREPGASRQSRKIIMEMDERGEIKDTVLMKKSIAVMALTTLGFAVHQIIHLESSVVALSGAALLMLISKFDPERAFRSVEWPVVFFFVGLFVVVGALEETGVIESIALFVLEKTAGAVLPASVFILWLSALASSFIDNIPFVATMIPLINDMGRLGFTDNMDVLWWSLSLGACFGGNGTIIGASANLVAVGIAQRSGVSISFVDFFKTGFPLMLMSVIISTFYIIAWYLLDTRTVLAGTLLIGAVLSVVLGRLGKRRRPQGNDSPGGGEYRD
ncbi:MAG: SLC13 family permease [Bacillota bacterium]